MEAAGLWAGAETAVCAKVVAKAEGTAEATAAATAAKGAATATLPSKIANKSPMLTLSPTLTFNSYKTPAADDGISMAALSDSTVMRDCSTLMASPGLTKISMTATSLNSPMSGT